MDSDCLLSHIRRVAHTTVTRQERQVCCRARECKKKGDSGESLLSSSTHYTDSDKMRRGMSTFHNSIFHRYSFFLCLGRAADCCLVSEMPIPLDNNRKLSMVDEIVSVLYCCLWNISFLSLFLDSLSVLIRCLRFFFGLFYFIGFFRLFDFPWNEHVMNFM